MQNIYIYHLNFSYLILDFKTILSSFTPCSYKPTTNSHCYSQKLPRAHSFGVGNLYLFLLLTLISNTAIELAFAPFGFVACMCHAQHLNLASASRFWLVFHFGSGHPSWISPEVPPPSVVFHKY